MAAITRDILGAWSQISGCLGCSSLWLPAILSHLTVFHFYNSQSIKCRRALWDVVKMFKIPLLPSKETNQSQFSVGAFLHLPPAQTAGTSDVRGGFVSPLTQPLLLCLGVHPHRNARRQISVLIRELECNLGALAWIPGFVTGLLYSSEQTASHLCSSSSPISVMHADNE